MPNDAVELPGSRHSAPTGLRSLGRVPEDQTITVSLYLRPQAETETPGAFTTRAAMRDVRGSAQADSMAKITAFASAAGLTLVEQDAARRLVKLSGTAQTLERAFGTELHHYKLPNGTVCRGRHGVLHVPADLSDRITAVLGLDTTPIATSKFVPHRGTKPPEGFLPTEVGRLYGFDRVDASGECIAIIELGGGYTAADNQAAFGAMGLPVPDIVAVSVDDVKNSPGDGSGADGEVALDIQVAGGVAPGARLAVYFAPNTSQGFADAISQAVHDDDNRPSTVSISWGSPEDGWSSQAVAAMHQAFEDAAQLGVSVFAASGDSLATDGETDGKPHVDYPASDPLVVGCGGTRIAASGDAISEEIVWKSNGGGTGGGVSSLFARPDYQDKVQVPASSTDGGGRGVPDVAGDADPDSGYRIVTNGRTGIIGGTSAAAPLWAGIFAGINHGRSKPIGAPHALLYANPEALRDITKGDNRSGSIGYGAATGWDPCTGLGSPKGAAMRSTFGDDGS